MTKSVSTHMCRAALICLTALAAACTDPDVAGSQFSCETDDDCSDDWVCVSVDLPEVSGVCKPADEADAQADAGGGDAGPDGGADSGADGAGADAGGCQVNGCPDDGLSCTTALCESDGSCTVTIAATHCVIAAACHEATTGPNSCTICNPAKDQSGWTILTDGLACDDDEPCTTGELCEGGECKEGGATVCDDENVCTTDTCTPGEGCTTTPVDGKCDDGDGCTTGEACSGGLCQGGAATDCDDGDACTADSCASNDCVHEQDPCDDGVSCTTDSCDSKTGVCAHTPDATSCEDGNPCATWECDLTAGCTSTALTGEPCDDGDACTVDDVCVGESCGGAAFPAASPLGAVEDMAPSPPWIATDGQGLWLAVWENGGVSGMGPPGGAGGAPLPGEASSIVYARSDNDGASWTVVGPISTLMGDPKDDTQASVATDGHGTWFIVFVRTLKQPGSSSLVYVAVSEDDGKTFGEPTAVDPAGVTSDGMAEWPVVGGGPEAGAAFVVWTSGSDLGGTTGGDLDLLISHRQPDGLTWSTPTALVIDATTDTVDDTAPSRALATDGAGRWVLAWEREQKHGIWSERDIVSSRSLDGGQTWSPMLRVLPSSDMLGESADEVTPTVATDGQGNWMLAWSSAQTPGGAPGEGDIGLAYSKDVAESWGVLQPPAPWMKTDTADDRAPWVASDGTGGWLLAWVTLADPDGTWGADSDAVVASSLDGGLSWTDPVLLVPGGVGEGPPDLGPMIGARALGGWLATLLHEGESDGPKALSALWKTPLPCTDDNVCTADTCGAAGACSSSPQVASCSDGDACTDGDSCSGTGCKSGEALDCDDGDPATADACDATLGCTHTL